jgi:iron complex outermembrane receptor protein
MKPLLLLSATLPLLASAEVEKLSPLMTYGHASSTGQDSGDVSVIDSADLQALPSSATATYEDLFATVPGGYAGNPTAGTFSLRGISQDNVFGYLGTGSNPLINVLEDGIPLSPNTLRYLPPVLFDLSGAEVHRGPQSFDGPNSFAGSVALHTRQPGFDWNGNAFTEYGEYATWRAGVAQDMILIPDELALRLSWYHQQSDGYETNIGRQDGEFGATQRDQEQARLLWHPGKNPDALIDLTLVHDQSRGNPFATVEGLGKSTVLDRRTSLNTESAYPADRWSAALNASLKLDNGLQIKSTTGVQRFDLEQLLDFDSTALLKWFVRGYSDEFRFTQQFTIADPDAGWLLGGYYEDSHYDIGFGGVGLARPPAGIPFDNNAREDARIAAIYGLYDHEIVSRLRLQAGLRLNYEEHDFVSSTVVGPFPRKTSAPDTSDTDLLPHIGVVWQPDAKNELGLQLSRGYRAGGVAQAGALGIAKAYDPEYSWDLELSGRTKPVDGLQLSSSIYYSWIHNQQVAYNVPGGFPNIDQLVTNGNKATRYGAEVEARWTPIDSLAFHSSFGWSHTEFDDLTLNGVNRSGLAFPNAPELTASIGADYHSACGVFGSVLYSWADTTYSLPSSPVLTGLESRDLLSARIGYAWDKASVYLFGSNLLNDTYALSRIDNTPLGLPVGGKVAPPRVVGVGCEVKW